MPSFLKLYHHMPYPLRCLAASSRGYYLQRWRYGRQTEGWIAQALAREQWSAAQWQTWQSEKLTRLLHRAATKVPYYRAQWQDRRQNGDRSSWELLENWPILTKEVLRQQPKMFVAEDCNTNKMFHEHTSGTTGKPLHLWWSKETVQAWYALFELRIRQWYGVSRHDRWAILGGQLVAPVKQKRPPFWVWNAGLKQLYLSSYHLTEQNIPAYIEALKRYRVTYLLGYSSAMYRVAQIVLELELDAPQMVVAIANAEPLYDYQRETISQAFHCPVRETYGMAEIVTAASECETGNLHLWPEVGVTEVLADKGDISISEGNTGRLICTSLLNQDMPLIRYEIGDRGALSTMTETCSCGRTLPHLQQVEGRMDDVIVTPDGRYIGRLDPIFKADLPIKEAQIIQERLDCLRLLIVPTMNYVTPDDDAYIASLVQERVGDMQVIIETTDHIPRTANGKFQAVISHLPKTEKYDRQTT
ncbi:MAG: phenylacetate--CoA ligase family protein [Anaerolineales bacterium]|nr:phenylacetate--CoA ligase family protein [Anaerolineales bacterium]